MSKLWYRPEIDALRAVSVIGVILYHAGFGFPGGYVGVDVFFVISGFLITSIIRKDVEADRFSMIQFWVRRIRRILPAALFMSLAVLLAGVLFPDPHSLNELGKSAVSLSVFGANI